VRTEIAVVAVVIALFAGAAVGLVSSSPGGHTTTVSTTTTTVTTTVGQFCSSPSSLPVLPALDGPGYSWSVNYSGRWNATAVGITGNGSVRFDQCYTSIGPGYVYVPDWSSTAGTTLTVVAHKMDSGSDRLSLAMNGELKNTTAPFGAVTVEAYTPYPSLLSGPGPQGIPVLVLDSGSSGVIAVTYVNALGNQIQDQQVYSSVYEPSADFRVVIPASISVTPSPSTISFNQGDRNASTTVLFRVSVATNVTSGIYGVFLYQFCTLFPMVIGSSQTGLNASDFSYWYPHTGSCPAQIMSAQVLYFSGFRVVYVPNS
jgi:hypothetical protein